jgi:hypothetical protein
MHNFKKSLSELKRQCILTDKLLGEIESNTNYENPQIQRKIHETHNKLGIDF